MSVVHDYIISSVSKPCVGVEEDGLEATDHIPQETKHSPPLCVPWVQGDQAWVQGTLPQYKG